MRLSTERFFFLQNSLFRTLLLLFDTFFRFRDWAPFGTRRARFSFFGVCIWRCFIRRIGTSLIGSQRCQTPFQRVEQRLGIFQTRLINHRHNYVHLRVLPAFTSFLLGYLYVYCLIYCWSCMSCDNFRFDLLFIPLYLFRNDLTSTLAILIEIALESFNFTQPRSHRNGWTI